MVLASLLQMVIITMLLCLGALLYIYLFNKGICGAKPDEAFTTVASQEGMPTIISVLLVLGVVSASFSSTGGALTSLTTSFAVDIIKKCGIPVESTRQETQEGTLISILLPKRSA